MTTLTRVLENRAGNLMKPARIYKKIAREKFASAMNMFNSHCAAIAALNGIVKTHYVERDLRRREDPFKESRLINLTIGVRASYGGEVLAGGQLHSYDPTSRRLLYLLLDKLAVGYASASHAAR